MTKLDEIALNVELVLISIIEGVALTRLGEAATPILHNAGMWWEYVPYVLAGIAILLVFWAQAILHAVSFIRWPLKMEHMLLYFLAGFLQIVAYSSISSGVQWFFWWTLFSALAVIIYIVDLHIIDQVAPSFATHPRGGAYIAEIKRRHIFEMKYLVPTALLFNVVALALIYLEPAWFQNPYAYAGLGTLQALFSLGALFDCIKNFKERSAMLPILFE